MQIIDIKITATQAKNPTTHAAKGHEDRLNDPSSHAWNICYQQIFSKWLLGGRPTFFSEQIDWLTFALFINNNLTSPKKMEQMRLRHAYFSCNLTP